MILSSLLLMAQLSAPARLVAPVLAFPEPGLDDSASGARRACIATRPAHAQVYLDRREGAWCTCWPTPRTHPWGSARERRPAPAPLRWDALRATVARTGRRRILRYAVASDAHSLTLGWFVLGSMRVERDFQHEKRHHRPFTDPAFTLPEFSRLIAALASLPPVVRARHLAALRATTMDELRGRLHPTVQLTKGARSWSVRVTQPSLDGRDTMSVAILGDSRQAVAAQRGDSIVIEARAGGAVRASVEVTTTGGTLTPLA
jgi:hypothetical protein